MLATVLRGLVPGVPYRAEVAAATGAGVGARSAPISIRIGECPRGGAATMSGDLCGAGSQGWLFGTAGIPTHVLAAPPVEQDVGRVGWGSMAERMAAVVRRPAFIAGVSGALWLILAGFAAWLYSRRRRRKELSHFTGMDRSLGPPSTANPTLTQGFLLQPPLPLRPRVHPWVL